MSAHCVTCRGLIHRTRLGATADLDVYEHTHLDTWDVPHTAIPRGCDFPVCPQPATEMGTYWGKRWRLCSDHAELVGDDLIYHNVDDGGRT